MWQTRAIMSPFQRLFVLEYLRDLNGTQAYIRAGGSEKTAGQAAHELLKNVEVKAAIAEAVEERKTDCKMDVAAVLKMWCEIATADPNELVRFERLACRHCYGKQFKHQWRDEAEWAEAINDAMVAWEKGKKDESFVMPDASGGFGFSPRLEPNNDCPKCEGNGVQTTHIADTRKLKGAARRLYAGVKQTKDGLQVLMRDQDAASVMVARHLGMLNDKLNLGGSVNVAVDEREALQKLSAEDLQQLLALREKMGG